MKNFYILPFLLFCILSISANAQSPTWLWAKSYGETVSDGGTVICTDANGNEYVTGYFYGPVTFGSTTLPNSGHRDIFVTKYDSLGNVIWAKSAGGTMDDFSEGIAADATGNVFITGHFRSPSITFGSTTLTNSGNQAFFMVKYSTSGAVIWAKGFNGCDYGHCVCTDVSGNSYFAGSFTGSQITFGTYTLTNSGTYDNLYLVKYNSAGTVIWAQGGGGHNVIIPNGIVVDNNGNSFITGYFNGSITFGSTTLNSTGGSKYDIFILKYSASGNVVWVKKEGGTNHDYVNSIGIDANGNSYVVGSFISDSITFGTTTLHNNSLSGWSDIFIVKYDTAGNALWAHSAGDNIDDAANGVSTDKNGSSYVIGNYSGYDIAFGTDTLHNSGTQNIFVVKYDSTGIVVWAKSIYCGSPYNGAGITNDANLNTYVTGSFGSNHIPWGNYTLLNNSVSPNQGNIFVAKLGACHLAIPTIVPSGTTTFCQGDSISLSSSSAVHYNWGNGVTTKNIEINNSGNYIVAVSDSSGCTSSSFPTVVTVNPNPSTPVITPNDSTTFCEGSNVILVSNASSNVIWSPGGQTTSAISVNSSGTYTVTAVDSNSCFATSLPLIVTVNPCTDINTVEDVKNIKIYPNPFTFQTSINFNEEQKQTTIKIFDVLGKKIRTINFSGLQLIIEKGDLQAGIYFVQIIDVNDNVAIRKIVCN